MLDIVSALCFSTLLTLYPIKYYFPYTIFDVLHEFGINFYSEQTISLKYPMTNQKDYRKWSLSIY